MAPTSDPGMKKNQAIADEAKVIAPRITRYLKELLIQ
jgi:hypothetical protein